METKTLPLPSELIQKVGPEYWKNVPCTRSTEENPHETLVPRGFREPSVVCPACRWADHLAFKNA